MRAVLLGNGSREGVLEGVESLRADVERCVEVAEVDFFNKVDLSAIDADVAIVFGGDGAILRAVHQMGENQLPILAVNLGTLGFLSSVNPEGLAPFLHSDAFKQFAVREQLLLNCTVWRRKKDGEEYPHFKTVSPRLSSRAAPSNWRSGKVDRFCYSNHLVVNEVAMQGGAPFSMVKIDLAVDGERVATVRGDGLIVATPVGSTAHSLSAGGPILRNELDSVVITPLAPQTLNFRPVVDSASRVYELQATSGEVYLVIDGESHLKLQRDDLVAIRRAPFPFKMFVVPENRYYRNLQRKLGWAVDPIDGASGK